MKPHVNYKGHIVADLAHSQPTVLSNFVQNFQFIVCADEMTCSC